MIPVAILLLVFVASICLAAGLRVAIDDRPSLRLPGFSLPPPPQRTNERESRRSRFRRGSRANRRRRAAIDAEIPQLLDLLAAGSSAGLAAPLALRRAVDGLAGPLADEIRATVRAVDLGARWRDELDALAERLDLPDMRRTVAALTRTESLGASLAHGTAELAAAVRRSRRAATAERARTAPVKMLFPLVFLVLPAFLLLTVVPVLLTTVRSIG